MSIAKWWNRKSKTELELAGVRAALGDVRDALAGLQDELRKRPPPFVAVVVMGELEGGKPTSQGASGYAGETLTMRAQQHMTNVRVVVLADLTKVGAQVFCGVDLVQSSLGVCPVAFFAEWVPGVIVSVVTIQRENSEFRLPRR